VTDTPIPDETRAGRPRAREVVFRALFEADATGDDPLEVLELSLGRFRFTSDGRAFALRLARGAGARGGEIDGHLRDLLRRWSLERVSSIARAILRLAITELIEVPETPARVIINESLRLADRYGEEDAAGFVNGVLDAAARRIRPGSLDDPAPERGGTAGAR
jgi:transcription antitermination protein NusB